ncbi:hypothetical protein ACSBR1_039456 [Camellia fascicularis]
MTQAHGEVIGNRIGRLVEVEAPLEGLLIHRSGCFYEKLIEFCYDYGHIGHDKGSCKFVSREEGLNSGYGPDQRTGPAKSLSSPWSQNKRPVEELGVRRDKLVQPMNFSIDQTVAR